MSEPATLAEARAEAEAARTRMLGTAHVLQDRLKPATIAGEVWERVREHGESTAKQARREIARRPILSASIAAGIAALLVRRPLARLFRRIVRRTPNPPAARKRSGRSRNGDE